VKKFQLILVVLAIFELGNAQIPNLNASNRLDVATWNVEWLGNSSNGPSNETVQMDNVTKLINQWNLDILGLCEVSSSAAWTDLLSKCSQYSGSISTWDQTQKTAVLFKKSEFKLAYSKHILADYSYDFASGRLPLEVALVPLNNKYDFDTIKIWVLHLKANTGTTSQKIEAYNRRYSASLVLKSYMQNLGNEQSGLILGDWNDDFDVSILSGYNTPFTNWTKDTQYLVASLPLSQSRQKSTVSYNEMIDHIVGLPAMKSKVITDSVFVINPSAWISSYGSSTSDHYPVYARFDISKTTTTDVQSIENEPMVFCNDDGYLDFRNIDVNRLSLIEQYDYSGKLLKQYVSNFREIKTVQSFVIVRLVANGSVYTQKIVNGRP